MCIDGSSSKNGNNTKLILVGPRVQKYKDSLKFGFPALNKKAKYKALIQNIELAKELRVKKLITYSDSQLVVE